MRLGEAVFLTFCTDRYQLLLSGSNVALERPFTVCIMCVIGFFVCCYLAATCARRKENEGTEWKQQRRLRHSWDSGEELERK